MEDICYIEGCPGEGKFTCLCNEKLRICQEHITQHVRESGNHDINVARNNLTLEKTKKAIGSLRKLNTSTLQKGKEMFKELCDKFCDVFDDISQRTEYLVDLSSSSYSVEVKEKIKELKTVNINLRDREQFGELLNKFMSKETFDSSNFNDFHKDFRVIAESIEKSNYILQLLTNSHQQEQTLRGQLECRVKRLEENHDKIVNIEEKVAVIEAKDQTIELESIKKLVEKANQDLKNVKKKLELTIANVQSETKLEVLKIEAIEASIMKAVKDSFNLVKSDCDRFKQEVSYIRDFTDPGFKIVIENFFDEVCYRRIVGNR